MPLPSYLANVLFVSSRWTAPELPLIVGGLRLGYFVPHPGARHHGRRHRLYRE